VSRNASRSLRLVYAAVKCPNAVFLWTRLFLGRIERELGCGCQKLDLVESWVGDGVLEEGVPFG
jgi:hypothetical protein